MLQVKPDATPASTAAAGEVPQKTTPNLLAAQEFIALLEDLAKNERGRIAALRRNAGEVLPGRGVTWFPSLIYKIKDEELRRRALKYSEIYFLIATLYGLNGKRRVDGDFGRTLSVIAEIMRPHQNADEARRNFRRFHILLDSSFDVIVDPHNPDAPVQNGGGEMTFRLRQLVKLCASKDVGINWPQLLADLCEWQRTDKRIQKKWARAYFGQRADAAPDADPAAENPAV